MNDLIPNEDDTDTSSNPGQAIQDRISPSAVYPLELQGIKPLDELWQRIRRDANGATYTRKRLTEEPELALAITVALNAAIEREYAIVLHNQSRVFTEILGRAFDGFRQFLNTSLAPADWQSRVAPSRVAMIEENVDSDEGAVADDAPKSKAVFNPVLLQKVLAAFLTPKIFLGVAVAILAVATGYSQLQVANYKSAIDSYKSAAEGANEEEKRYATTLASLKTQLDDKEKRISSIDVARVEMESRVITTEKSLATRDAELKSAKDTITRLESELSAQRGDDAELVQKAEEAAKLATAERDVLKAKLADIERENTLLKESAQQKEVFYTTIKQDLEKVENQCQVFARRAESAESDRQQLMLKVRLLALAEQALDNSYNALPYGRNRSEQKVYEAVKRYRDDKAIFLGQGSR